MRRAVRKGNCLARVVEKSMRFDFQGVKVPGFGGCPLPMEA
jgi:hypothetical protein